MKNLIITSLFVLTAAISFNSYAELQISGYGSIIVGKTLGSIADPIADPEGRTIIRDEIFTADF